jgi:uncharacterized cupin superfamily protein
MVNLAISRSFRAVGGGMLVVAAGSLLWAAGTLRATTSPGIVPIDIGALDKASTAPIEDTDYWKVVGIERPPAASVSTFVSADKLLEAGVSRYDRVTLELREWPVDEFMYIIEGRVEITPAGGRPHVYGPGDAFVMPKGFNGTWKQLSNLKKFQVTYSRPE